MQSIWLPRCTGHWGCDALMTNDRAFQLFQAPIEVLRLEPDQPLNQQT